MAQFAIKGHATRGKEVIEILEMLGGKNKQGYTGQYNYLWYYINVRSEICVFKHSFDGCNFFTIEEFLEKYPYKVGDKVKDARINDIIGEIINARWDDSENQIIYLVEWDDETKSTLPSFARDLQPYKETMTNRKKVDLRKAKFGDVFKTRGGAKAILLHRNSTHYLPTYEFISAWSLDSYSHYFTDENGRAKVSNDWKEREHDVDIVDVWEHK